MVKLKMNKKFKIPCEQIVQNKQNCMKGINNLLNVFLNSFLKNLGIHKQSKAQVRNYV